MSFRAVARTLGAFIMFVSVILGVVIAFWLFAAAFNLNIAEFNRAAIGPLLLGFFSVSILVLIQPKSLKGIVVGASAPTLLINSLFFIGVLAEGRGAEWSHIITALKVFASVLAGAAFGFMIHRIVSSSSTRR